MKSNKPMSSFRIIPWIVILTLLASCSQPTPAATSTPQPSETPLPSPIARPTATSTSMPEMPQGPFVWTGETRPLLMAHYMPWYQTAAVSGSWGWHWTMNHFQPRQGEDGAWENLASRYSPLTGPYDSSDEAVLVYQVMLMKLSGIDGVIVDWYGIESFWDYGTIHKSTLALFDLIQRAGMKFVICYEDQTVKHMVNNGHLDETEAVTHGQAVMAFLQETWFTKEAYLHVDGQPVLLTFGPQYFDGPAWETLFSGLDPRPFFITLDNHVVPASAASYPWPPMWAAQAGVLSHDVLLSYLESFYEKSAPWEYRIAGAFPGFHDIYKEAGVGSSYGYLDDLEGSTFRLTLQKALDQQPDMTQRITWNDYGECTIIEPTVLFGYRYLEMVQEARHVIDPEDAGFTSEALRLPFVWYTLYLQSKGDSGQLASLDQAFEALIAGDLATVQAIIAP